MTGSTTDFANFGRMAVAAAAVDRLRPSAQKARQNTICFCFFNSSTDLLACDHANLTMHH